MVGRLAVTAPTTAPQLDIDLPGVTWRDRLPAIVLASMIVAFGLQPNWMARWSEHTTLALHEPYQGFVQTSTLRLEPQNTSLVANTQAVATPAQPFVEIPIETFQP